MKTKLSQPLHYGEQTQMRCKEKQRDQASALITTLGAVTLVVVLIGISAGYTANNARLTQRGIALETARTVGEAALELAFAQWRDICRANARTPRTTEQLAGIVPPTAEDFPGLVEDLGGDPNQFTIQNLSVVAVDPVFNESDVQAARREVGLNANSSIYSYLASVDVTVPTTSGPVSTRVTRVFRQLIESPWSYAIFYENDLEIHPGPEMFVTGDVHTNSDLYAASGSLNFLKKVTSVGAYNNFRKENRNVTGNPNFAEAHQRVGRKDPLGVNPNQWDRNDSNPNNDGYRELLEKPVPGFEDPLARTNPSQRLYTNAELKVEISGTATNPIVRMFRGQGNNPTEIFANSGTIQNREYYKAVRDALTVGQSIYNQREQGWVGITTLDVGKFEAAVRSNKLPGFTNSSVIHITDNRAIPSGGARYGVRLANGQKLPKDGLTVVSDLPVYIQGDYNTGGSPPSNASNAPLTAQNYVQGYEVAPAAVVSDAVTILSNAWSDGNSNKSLAERKASRTTVNAGIMTGILKTTPDVASSYNGGAENFPRFLEDWGGVNFTYYGSMVNLYESIHATGLWRGTGPTFGIYNPPVRRWFFDERFRTAPPPGFLVTTMFTRGLWMRERAQLD
ncbi:MAG: hypothetical protein SNJ52_04235 [Verrucomicrobiia bacterium]